MKQLNDLKIENKTLNEGLIEFKKIQFNLQDKVICLILLLHSLPLNLFSLSRFLNYNDMKNL
jgi:hypothetical protein